MPELPEVESVRQCLLQAKPSMIGRTVREVRILRHSVVDGDPAALQQLLTGCTCQEIRRHAKYLFFGFAPPQSSLRIWMALHLRMTGRLFLVPEYDAVERYTRLTLLLDQGVALRFDDPRAFGRVWLLGDPSDVITHLGPDALTVSHAQFMGVIRTVRRQLKPLLLDQRCVAGIGNIYADELLFRAGLHPLRTAASLTESESERLYDALHSVMLQAVALKGANVDGVFEAGSFPVAVYGRQGQPCMVCGTEIKKIKVAQRGTHVCTVCQPFSGDL